MHFERMHANLNALFELSAQDNSLNIDRRDMDIFRWNGTVFYNLFYFCNGYFSCFAHCWIEIARRFPVRVKELIENRI